MLRYKKRLLLATTASLALQPQIGVAQLEEVIVTAQKREQNLQDVPMAITAIGGELLQDNEINNIEDLTKLVPSLRFTPGDSPRNNSLRIRGVGTDVFSSAVEPNVAVVVDGVPLARTSLASFEFADIERIEVLRGPQGTLFGKNASAGLVHVITRDPHESFEARIRTTYEQPDEYPGDMTKTQFSVSGPVSEAMGVRFTGFWKQDNGHIEDIEQDRKLPNQESYGVRAKLQWDLSDVLALRLSAEYQRYEGDSYPFVYASRNPEAAENVEPIEPGEENRQTRTFNEDIPSDGEIRALTAAVDWEVGKAIFTSITGYRDADLLADTSGGPLDGTNVFIISNGGPRTIETFTQEFRLASSGEAVLDWTVGTLLFENRLFNDFDRFISDFQATGVAGIGGLPALDIPGNVGSIDVTSGFENTVDTTNIGLFGQFTWDFATRWHLTAGLRYIDEEVAATYSSFQDISDSATGAPLEAASTSVTVPETMVSDTAVTGTASIQYDWGEHSTLYATYARGYRGVAFDITTTTGQEEFDDPVDPETANSFELGIKSRLFDERLEVNVTAYLTTFKDFQAQLIDTEGGGFSAEVALDNAGELETRGLEIDFTTKPINALTVYGSILFNRAVFNEFITQCYVGQGPDDGGAIDADNDGACDANDVSGGVLANAPKWSGSLTARYEHNLGDSGSFLFGQVTGRYQTEVQFQNDQNPNTTHEDYSIWDLRLGYIGVGGRLEVAAYAKNLFAQHYQATLFALSLENDPRDILHNIPKGSDRIFGLSVGYQF